MTKDIVEEAREMAEDYRYDIQPAARAVIRALADEVQRLREENKQLKTCDHCERPATRTVCDLHEGR